MSTFLEIALPLAERGFRVFPLVPKNKMPVKLSWGDHFDMATTDIPQLEQWDRDVPRANVGLSPDENFCFLETDDEVALREACADLTPEIWDTARVSARDNRCYYILRQTMRTRKAGNMTVTRAGQENLFEFKQFRVYVVGPGSIHPKTGKPYGVEWRTIPAMPDMLLNRLCELYGAPKATDSHKMDAETIRQTALLDKFLLTYEVATTGDWFPKGQQWYRPIVCPWLAEHENSNQGTSTCIVYTEGGGYGFDCKHRCAAKTWKEFRAEVQGRFPDRKFTFVEPSFSGVVSIGSSQPAKVTVPTPEEAPARERKRPVYPIAIWDGTAAGEFAKICTHDNNIPRKFFVEAWTCILGAVVGDRLTSTTLGGIPRSYTFLITKAGYGKGTVIRRCTGFWKAGWVSSSTTAAPGFLRGEPDFSWKPTGIGARNASASSGPGMTRLILDNKKTPVHLSWHGTIPRIISVHEETKTFLSALFIEGGTGTNLDGVVCSLWDDVEFAAPGTGTRQAVYGEMQFSMLCAITEGDWFDLLSKGDVVGGGLMSRLNLIGSLGEYDRVSDIKKDIEFSELQKQILPRIERLADAPCILAPTEGARRVMADWHLSLPEDAVRANVRAWRSALVLSFLRREDNISEKTAIDATLLGDPATTSIPCSRRTTRSLPFRTRFSVPWK
jgi:hypothetical protein